MSLEFDLSGVSVRLRALGSDLAREFTNDWGRFQASAREDRSWDLDVVVGASRAPAPSGVFNPKSMTASVDQRRAAFEMPEGRALVSSDGSASLDLAPSDPSHQFYAAVNLLCACLAWLLPSRGGAILHAAGVVLGGRAFLMVGPERSGKTTWATLAKRSGALLLSDDIVMVQKTGSRVEALSAPFRDDHPEGVSPGRWPVAALLIPSFGTQAALCQVSGSAARARLAANMPFVADLFGSDPRPMQVVGDLLESLEVRQLVFAMDATFVDLLRKMPD